MKSDLHILFVDDVPAMRWFLTSLLHVLGYEKVTVAEDGKEALRILQENETARTPVDFIITDWQMPVMNGHALLQEIRASVGFKHLPVVVFSSRPEAEIRSTAGTEGIDGYICKTNLRLDVVKAELKKNLVKKGRAI